jgi:hypothetical protein
VVAAVAALDPEAAADVAKYGLTEKSEVVVVDNMLRVRVHPFTGTPLPGADQPVTLASEGNSPRLLRGVPIPDTASMITFIITAEDRRRAQARAAELDICLTDPPGKYPHVWDNRQNCVKRWYDYESGENKIGTIYFEAVAAKDGKPSDQVRCTTEITYHPGRGRRLHHAKLEDPVEHQWLADLFRTELLGAPPIR